MGNFWYSSTSYYLDPNKNIKYQLNIDEFPYITIDVPKSISDEPYVVYYCEKYQLHTTIYKYYNKIPPTGTLDINYNYHVIVRDTKNNHNTRNHNYYSANQAIKSAKLFFHTLQHPNIEIIYVKVKIFNINGYSYKVGRDEIMAHQL